MKREKRREKCNFLNLLLMKYTISAESIQKALDVIVTTVSSKKSGNNLADHLSDEDLLFYDNVSMMEKLKVTERTLQRYRKNGKIRFIRFGGKIYYPKNFMVLPLHEPEVSEDEKAPIIPLNEYIKKYNTPRPRSRIIDVDRLAKRLTYFPRSENKNTVKDFKKLVKYMKIKRKKNHASLQLWPKKIKLIGLPIVTSKTITLK